MCAIHVCVLCVNGALCYTCMCIVCEWCFIVYYLFIVAITYECIRTITAIYPNAAVIKKAAGTISRFLTNQNNNWKYLGQFITINID